MNSGVKVMPAVSEQYKTMRLAKSSLNYMVCRLDQAKKNIELETDAKEGDYDAFVSDLVLSGKPRFGIFKCPQEWGKAMLVFFAWSDDNSSVHEKMVYASSREHLKLVLGDIGGSIQANCPDDLQLKNVLATLQIKPIV